MMVHAYVHRIMQFRENEQIIQNEFSSVFVWNTVVASCSAQKHAYINDIHRHEYYCLL